MTELVFASIGAAAAIAILLISGFCVYRGIRYGGAAPPYAQPVIGFLAVIGAATPPYSAWGTGAMVFLATVSAFICWADRDQRPPKGI